MDQLIIRCIDVESVQFAIFHGLSDNRFKRLDITDAREIVGCAPRDDFTEANITTKPIRLSDRVDVHNLSDFRQKSGLRDELGAAATKPRTSPNRPGSGKSAPRGRK